MFNTKYFANIKDKQSYIHLYNELNHISEIKSCFTNLNLYFELWLTSMFKITVLKIDVQVYKCTMQNNGIRLYLIHIIWNK